MKFLAMYILQDFIHSPLKTSITTKYWSQALLGAVDKFTFPNKAVNVNSFILGQKQTDPFRESRTN